MSPDSLAWWNQAVVPGFPLTAVALGQALAILVGAWLVSVLLRRALALAGIRRGVDPGIRYSLGRLLHLAILVLAVLLALNALGLNLASLAVVGGALGIGIGFGLQGIAANFVAGLVLLFERPIRVGDRITLGTLEADAVTGINGYVQSISLRGTTVLTPDNITLIVPNQDLVTHTVVNWSHGEPRMRIRVNIGVAYDSDLEQVRKILDAVAREHPETLKEPGPEVRLINTADSALTMQVLVWIADPRRRGRVDSDLRWAMVQRFRAEGVVMPFPQREIRIMEGLLEKPA